MSCEPISFFEITRSTRFGVPKLPHVFLQKRSGTRSHLGGTARILSRFVANKVTACCTGLDASIFSAIHMQALEQIRHSQPSPAGVCLPVTVIIPTRNEAANLRRCLESLAGTGEVYVIDSNSSDETPEIARTFGAKVVQFHYHGGWPKKRQWALDTLAIAYDWVLLLDADEALTPELSQEIREAIQHTSYEGFYIPLQMVFLKRVLRHSGASFQKLSLFRRGKGHFECRLRDQDETMCDMEIHEHIIVDGATAGLKNPLLHRNTGFLFHYVAKHNEYSNWEARVWMKEKGNSTELPPALLGTQAQRRRWLRKNFFRFPGSSVLFFLYKYFCCLGFLDGVPGLIYCGLQGIQFFHIKAKIYELAKG
jgi:glycosyltransferase involved in cell wall biosynthesis